MARGEANTDVLDLSRSSEEEEEEESEIITRARADAGQQQRDLIRHNILGRPSRQRHGGTVFDSVVAAVDSAYSKPRVWASGDGCPDPEASGGAHAHHLLRPPYLEAYPTRTRPRHPTRRVLLVRPNPFFLLVNVNIKMVTIIVSISDCKHS
jgi:hypothetical protein